MGGLLTVGTRALRSTPDYLTESLIFSRLLFGSEGGLVSSVRGSADMKRLGGTSGEGRYKMWGGLIRIKSGDGP